LRFFRKAQARSLAVEQQDPLISLNYLRKHPFLFSPVGAPISEAAGVFTSSRSSLWLKMVNTFQHVTAIS
jgi:hypothetical protein